MPNGTDQRLWNDSLWCALANAITDLSTDGTNTLRKWTRGQSAIDQINQPAKEVGLTDRPVIEIKFEKALLAPDGWKHGDQWRIDVNHPGPLNPATAYLPPNKATLAALGEIAKNLRVWQTARAEQLRATPDTDWRDVQRRLLEMSDQGKPYTNLRDLMKRTGCRSTSTVSKAIKRSTALIAWKARHSKAKGSPRASSLTEFVTDNTAQPREADPSNVLTDDDVDDAMRHLIEEAKPEERAKLNDLDAEGRRAMAETYYAHKLDEEPSPLEDDPPDSPSRRVVQHKRL